jgi:Leucine-rich repeat (LRR) protein
MFWGNKRLFQCFLFIFFFGSIELCLRGMDDQYANFNDNDDYNANNVNSDEDESTNLIASNTTSINYNSINSHSSNYLFLLKNPDKINDLFNTSQNEQQKEALINELKEFLNYSLLKNPKFIFDTWIKKIQNPDLRIFLIKFAITRVMEIYSIDNLKNIEQFFHKQPEGILTTAIRFIHLRKTDKLIDSKDITYLNDKLIDASQSGILNFGISFIEDILALSYKKIYPLFPYLCEIIPHICQKPIKKLSLSGNFLSRIPEEICYLKDLKEIDLSGNKFDKIPTVLLKLKNLKKITVDQKLEKDNNRTKFYSILPDCKILFYDSKTGLLH